MHPTLNKFLTKIGEENKYLKNSEFYESTKELLSAGLKGLRKGATYFSDAVNLKYANIEKSVVKEIKVIKDTAGGKFGGGKMFALDLGLNSIVNYVNDEPKKRNIGRAMIDGAIDTVVNMGPVNGAIYGASLSATFAWPIVPIAIAIGATGLVLSSTNFLVPDFSNKVKNFAHSVEDITVKEFNSIKNNVSSGLNDFGKGIKSTFNSAAKRLVKCQITQAK